MTANRRVVLWSLGLVGFMGALSFAAVPLYDWFCRVTGYGGTTTVAAAPGGEVLEQTIRVRFDASLERGMPWRFRPMQREVTLKLGEQALVFYEAHNPTDRPVAGTASFNVTPYAAGSYFAKVECFCFTEQVLAPGERVEMPVSFFVDPAILADREGKFVHTITLSYTFHETPLPEGHVALEPDDKPAGAVPSEG